VQDLVKQAITPSQLHKVRNYSIQSKTELGTQVLTSARAFILAAAAFFITGFAISRANQTNPSSKTKIKPVAPHVTTVAFL
jgi:hypothetical protein